jgi:hypothetical protein
VGEARRILGGIQDDAAGKVALLATIAGEDH